MILRTATLADLPRMAELLGELFSLETDFTPNLELQLRGLTMLRNRPAAELFVAEADGRVVGMCTVQILVSTAAGAEIGSVEDVVIAPAWRGKGIGSALVGALEQWAIRRGLARLQLQADTDNAPALEFYGKLGWERTHLTGLWKRFPDKAQQPAMACSGKLNGLASAPLHNQI